MRRFYLVTAGLLAGLGGCREPTQITVELRTDVACGAALETTLGVGTLTGLKDKPPVVTQKGCKTADGRIGSVVIVPSGEKDDEVAIQAILGANGQLAAGCDPLSPQPNCVVARRALRYVPHTPLFLPIALTSSCLGKTCPIDQTCVDGQCQSAKLPDPETCTNPGGCANVADAGADAAVPAAGLVLHYTFDQPGVLPVPDLSGNGNDGQLVGTATVKPYGGRYFAALHLDGAFGTMIQVDAAKSASLQTITPATGFTFAVWLSATGYPVTDSAGFLLWKYGQDIDIAIDPSTNAVCGDVLFESPPGGGFDNDYSVCTGPQVVPLKAYHHVAFTYGDGRARVYVDGTPRAETNASANFTVNEVLFFGNAIAGTLDDLRLYNHALTEAEIAALSGT